MRMLDLSHIGAVYIACGYTDMRRGINGLAAQVQQQYQMDPRAQAVFLFCGKRSDRFKALFWDGDGFILLAQKSVRKLHLTGYYSTLTVHPQAVIELSVKNQINPAALSKNSQSGRKDRLDFCCVRPPGRIRGSACRFFPG